MYIQHFLHLAIYSTGRRLTSSFEGKTFHSFWSAILIPTSLSVWWNIVLSENTEFQRFFSHRKELLEKKVIFINTATTDNPSPPPHYSLDSLYYLIVSIRFSLTFSANDKTSVSGQYTWFAGRPSKSCFQFSLETGVTFYGTNEFIKVLYLLRNLIR